MSEEQVREREVEVHGAGRTLLLLWSAAALVSLALSSWGGGGGGGEPAILGDPLPGADSPDLVPAEVTVEEVTVSAGSSIQVSDVVQNLGVEFAGPFSIAVYLSEDAVIDSNDRQLGLRSIAGLASGAHSSGGGSVTVPASTVAGTYFVGVVVDEFQEVVEADETNNALMASASLEVTPAVFPNLRAVEVSIPQAMIDAGQVLQVTDTVENLGTVNAGSFIIGIHLSPDPTITSTDLMIGVRAIPELGAGEQSMAVGPITIPLSTPAGSWYIGTVVDVQGDIEETDEFDNTAVATQLLEITTPPLPDLGVDQISFSGDTVDVGSLLEVSETITNSGQGASAISQVGIYLSEDAIIDSDDILIGSRVLPALEIGESSMVSTEFTVPQGTPGGTYHVGAIADHLDEVPELSEANNGFASAGLVTVVVPPLPDLAMIGFSFTPGLVTAGTGGTLSITDTVENRGVLPAGTFRIGYYLSSNTAITASDLLVGTRMVSGLAPGATSTTTTEMPIVATIPGGSWFVGAIADDLGVITEPTFGNNAIFSGSSLDIVSSPDPMPDLEMRNLTFTPHSAVAGSTLSFQDQVRNIGTLSSGTFHVGVYLSDDDEITVDDTQIAERIVFNLAIDFGSASSFQAILPDNLAEGDYFIGAIADNREVLKEGDEDNNMFRTISGLNIFVPPPPMPDLVVTAVSFTPDSASPSGTVSISDTVRNSGNLDTGASIEVAYYLSDDEEITRDDRLLGSRAISGLDIAQESNGTTQLTLPLDVDLGTYRLGAIIDDPDTVIESNEENNSRAAVGNLEVQ